MYKCTQLMFAIPLALSRPANRRRRGYRRPSPHQQPPKNQCRQCRLHHNLRLLYSSGRLRRRGRCLIHLPICSPVRLPPRQPRLLPIRSQMLSPANLLQQYHPPLPIRLLFCRPANKLHNNRSRQPRHIRLRQNSNRATLLRLARCPRRAAPLLRRRQRQRTHPPLLLPRRKHSIHLRLWLPRLISMLLLCLPRWPRRRRRRPTHLQRRPRLPTPVEATALIPLANRLTPRRHQRPK